MHISAKSCQPLLERIYNLQIAAETLCTESGAYHSPLADWVIITNTTVMWFHRTCETPTNLSFDIKKWSCEFFDTWLEDDRIKDDKKD